MNFRKGINAIYTNVYPIFLKAQKKSTRTSSYMDAVNCLEQLSKGFVAYSSDRDRRFQIHRDR